MCITKPLEAQGGGGGGGGGGPKKGEGGGGGGGGWGGGGGRLIKCQGLKGGENWNAVCKLN